MQDEKVLEICLITMQIYLNYWTAHLEMVKMVIFLKKDILILARGMRSYYLIGTEIQSGMMKKL